MSKGNKVFALSVGERVFFSGYHIKSEVADMFSDALVYAGNNGAEFFVYDAVKLATSLATEMVWCVSKAHSEITDLRTWVSCPEIQERAERAFLITGSINNLLEVKRIK